MEIQGNISNKEKVHEMGVELERLCAENKELNLMLDAMNNKYNNLHAHVKKIHGEIRSTPESSSSHDLIKRYQIDPLIKPKSSRILVRTNEANPSLIVKDGYQWRKYGQKVTKDNPSPRAYFRCAMAPTCHVKKKVQRCAEDNSILVATYEGEHNHPLPGEIDCLSSKTGSMAGFISPTFDPHLQPITLDLTLCRSNQEIIDNTQNITKDEMISSENNLNVNNNTMEDYITLLTRDPNVRSALAGAVARSVLYHRPSNS